MNPRSAVLLAAIGIALSAPARADAPPSWREAPEGTLHLTTLVLARGVENRQATDIAPGQTIPADGKRLYAYLELFNKGAKSALKLTWRRGERVHHQVTLVAGRSPSWRTWAFVDARPSLKGAWSVTVVDGSGRELVSRSFTLE